MTHELHIEVREAGQTTELNLSGWFDFSSATKFRKAVRDCLKHEAMRELVIDFGRLEYLDSLAMGALMVCREQLQKEGKPLVLANCKGLVLEALQLANFHKLFTLR